jgi:cell division protein FtsQ
VRTLFPIQKITFSGNTRLTDEELRTAAGVHLRKSLVFISNKKISQQLLKSPWVKSVHMRKEFPDTLALTIRESEPFAILDKNDHLYLIDEDGKILEELRNNSIPFLPIISSDPVKEKEGLKEALNLVKTMNDEGMSSDWEHIEIIAHKPQEISLSIDGTCVKIGAGMYKEKLGKLVQLEKEIMEMGIPIEYIDLRFEKRAVVKPVTDMVTK